MRGQGSLEYLLILAAILAIAVVVVVVANTMLRGGTASAGVNQDKLACANAGIELVGYNQRYAGPSEAKALRIKYTGVEDVCSDQDIATPDASCVIYASDGTTPIIVKVDYDATQTDKIKCSIA